ncbi:MAG: hypothetical protein IPH86_08455 [bacterium]|nr:hypothetical protein [bacterium]
MFCTIMMTFSWLRSQVGSSVNVRSTCCDWPADVGVNVSEASVATTKFGW